MSDARMKPMYVIAPNDTMATGTHLVPGLNARADAIENAWHADPHVGAARALWDAANDRWYVETWPAGHVPEDERKDWTGFHHLPGNADGPTQAERPTPEITATLDRFTRGLHDIDEIAHERERRGRN